MDKIARIMALATLLTAGQAAGAEPTPGLLTDLPLGRHVYLTYCAGCHGFDGQAFFPAAPSFAMGERLLKSDAELMQSIREGRNEMPSWESKLPTDWLENALGYIRYMADSGETNGTPDYYYVFPPPGSGSILEPPYWPVLP